MAKKITSKRRKRCASSERSLAAEVIGSNEDLLTEILLRVPAKSLLRFKCVSKHWLSLISNPQFACNHTRQNHNSSTSGLYFNTPLKERVKSVRLHGRSGLPALTFLDGIGGRSRICILHSCNGLMLCSNGYYIVCNLTTQKYTLFPKPGASIYGSYGARLAFDPSKSPHYKVVAVNYFPYSEQKYAIDIYSSKSSSWKRMHFTAPPGTPFFRKVFWNGAIHWMSDENVHIQFDVDAEKLTGTPMPPRPKILQEYKIRYFGECHGHLLLIQTRSLFAKGFHVLEMDKDYCRWIVKYRVNLRPVISALPEMADTCRRCKYFVLCIMSGASEEDFELVLAIPGKVISYNLNSKAFKVLRNSLPAGFPQPNSYNLVDAYQFIESLSSV